jgi:phosphatidate cytidylyltransferase
LNEFFKRTVTGAAFVITILGSIIWSPFSLLVLLLVVSSLSLYEYYSIFKLREYKPLTISGIVSGILIISLVFLERQGYIPHKFLELLMVPVFGIWFTFFFLKKADIMGSLIVTVSGLIYILLPLSLILFITHNTLSDGYNPQILLGTLFIIWIYDSGAYIFGSLLGKHKMAPRFSPKKSWEGLFGGTAFAILFSVLIAKYFTLLNPGDWMILSVIIVLSSTAGDLFESLIKREAGLKDSGKIFPGHGGMLDRFDSLFFAIPFVFLYLYLLKI